MPPEAQLRILVNAEIEDKRAALSEMENYLEDAQARMTRAPGCPTILDTNVLVQCLKPDQFPWRVIVGEECRLVLPPRVIEEIDAKKHGVNDRLRQVSRDILAWLERLSPGPGSGPVPVGSTDGTMIEIALIDRPRFRPMDPDEEVLDVYDEVKLLVGRSKLVTADTGMLLRARSLGIDACMVPDDYLRLKAVTDPAQSIIPAN
jgi:predicted ribonuclease YlaK